MSARSVYTKADDTHLVEFIADQCPGLSGRQGNKIYQTLVENPKKYPWAKGHSWQGWRERYKSQKAYFDHKIAKYQKANGIVVNMEGQRSSQRVAFTDDEDKYLVKFLAWYCRQKEGRSGYAIYRKLGDNADNKWPWSARHPWQGWRSRYIDHKESLDLRIHAYQLKHNIDVNASPQKREANGCRSERPVKRRKVEDTYDSQESEWSRICWPSPAKNVAHPKIVDRAKAGKLKVEVKQETPISPGASMSRGRVVSEDKPDDERDRDDGDSDSEGDEGDDDDYESDNPQPIGSEDYRGDIFQNGTTGESQGKLVEEMPGIEEEEEEIFVNDPSPVLNDRSNASPEKGPEKVKALLPVRDKPDEDSPVHEGSSSSLFPPKPAQPTQHGSFSKNDFTMISQSRRVLNDDPFEDAPLLPCVKRGLPLRKAKNPPAIIEGAFGTRLQKERKKISIWSSAEESSDDKETSATWLPPPRPPLTKASDDEEEVVATWPPPRVKKTRSNINGTKTKIDMERQATEQRRREKGKQKALEPDESGEIMVARREVHVDRRHSPMPSPIKPFSLPTLNTPEAGAGRITNTQRRVTDIFAPPAPHSEPMGVKSPKRHSTGNMDSAIKSSNSRTINLRQELAHRQLLQQQKPLSTRRSSSRASRASSSIVSEDDSQISQMREVGFQVVKMFSEEFGFTEDVVLKAWNTVKSLVRLKEVLARMKESADRQMVELMKGMSTESPTSPKKGRNSSGPFETRLQFDKMRNTDTSDFDSSQSSSFLVYPDPDDSSAIKERRNSSVGGSGNRGRKSLEIRLVDPECAFEDVQDLYEPFTGTRAGNFSRLARMGREEEALEREQRRVSSVALSPLRNISQELQLQTQGRPEGETQEVNDGDMVEEIEIPIQSEDSDEDAETMDVLPGSGQKDEEMGEDNYEVEGRIMKGEPTSTLPQLDGQERRYYDLEGDEQSELDDTHPNINGHENVEQDIKVEPDVDGMKSRPAEEVEAMVMVQSEAERWEEVESLFRAANRSNMEMLKKIEKNFGTEFLKEWLLDKFML